ncbi:hypothetical protein N9803_02675 [Gammaproteobacteria bacterium]|nr:hypothetical protein [Gammaproteobacteria bacterium]
MIYIISILYVSMIWLDYHSQQKQISVLLNNEGIANSYVWKNKVALASRMMSFFLAPIVGVLITKAPPMEVIGLFAKVTFIAAIVVLASYTMYVRNFLVSFKDILLHMKNGYSLASVLCFSLYLNAGFIMNIIAGYYPSHAVWLVQLAPLITSITTLYIVLVYDNRCAKEFDSAVIKEEIVHALLLERVLARIFMSCMCFIFYILWM